MKATEFTEMVNTIIEVVEKYIQVNKAHYLDEIDELLWNNFEHLIDFDDRNYN